MVKRPGSFTPHLPDTMLQELACRATELYQAGWTMEQVAAELGISSSTVRLALYTARLSVRGGGGARGREAPARVLVDKL